MPRFRLDCRYKIQRTLDDAMNLLGTISNIEASLLLTYHWTSISQLLDRSMPTRQVCMYDWILRTRLSQKLRWIKNWIVLSSYTNRTYYLSYLCVLNNCAPSESTLCPLALYLKDCSPPTFLIIGGNINRLLDIQSPYILCGFSFTCRSSVFGSLNGFGPFVFTWESCSNA